MKNIYIVYDDIAQEPVMPYFANNDEHAKKILNDILQKEKADVEFSVYNFCDIEKEEFKSKLIFQYPSKPENSVKLTNKNIDKIMEE